MNSSKQDIALCVNNKILETGTSNLLFVYKKKIYSPKSNYYKGTNIKFYEKKFRIIKKDIYLKDIEQFEEIILVGSGKGVVSVNFIDGYNCFKFQNIMRKFFIHLSPIIFEKKINSYISVSYTHLRAHETQ